MFKYARELFFLAMALFFVTLTIASIYATSTIFGNDGVWVSKVVSGALARRAKKATSGKSLGEKVVDRLLKNDGELFIKMAKKVMKKPKSKKGSQIPNPNQKLLSKTLDRLLANEGALLSTILAKMNAKRKNPVEKAFRTLLARDGRILSKVLIRVSRANARKSKGSSIPQMLLKHPKVISRILGDVLERVGVKSIMRTAKGKVRAIQTRVSLQREIRHALSKLPQILAKMMELQQKKKSLGNKSWRKIKAQFPRIRRSFRNSQCLRLLRLRRIKNNRIQANIRVKITQAKCRKRSCVQNVERADQAILKWTRRFGIHEGHIQLKFGFIKRKCNTNR